MNEDLFLFSNVISIRTISLFIKRTKSTYSIYCRVEENNKNEKLEDNSFIKFTFCIDASIQILRTVI